MCRTRLIYRLSYYYLPIFTYVRCISHDIYCMLPNRSDHNAEKDASGDVLLFNSQQVLWSKKRYLITIQTSVSISASSQSVLVRYALDLENRDCPLSFTLESHQVSMTSRPAWIFWTGAVINNSFSAHMEPELHTRARLNLPPLDNYMFLKLYFTMWFHRFNSTNWQVKLLSCWIIHRSMSLWILALSSQWSFGRDQHSSQVFNAKVKMTRVIQV